MVSVPAVMVEPTSIAGLLMQPMFAKAPTRLADAEAPAVPTVLPANIFIRYDFTFLRQYFDGNDNWCGPDQSGFDIETEGVLCPHDGEVATLQLELNGFCYVVHVPATGTLLDVPDVEYLQKYLTDNGVCKIIHNAKFELKWMMKYFGYELYVDNIHDTILAEYILAAGFGFGEPSKTSFEFDSSILALGEIMFRRYKVVMDKDADLRQSFRRYGLVETVAPEKDPVKLRSDVCVVEGCTHAPAWLAGGKAFQVCDYHCTNNKLVTALKGVKKWVDYPPRPLTTQKTHGELTVRQAMYAAFDVLYMAQLAADQTREMAAHKSERGGTPYPALFQLDCRCAEALARMELRGIPVDTTQAAKTHLTLTWQASSLLAEIIAECTYPGEEPINPGSRDQMRPRLAEKFGINLPDYKTSTLQRFVEHSIIKKILKWKQVDKLSSFTKAFLVERNPETGCVHSSFNQVVTATSRLSSSDPNLQNIPSKSKLSAEIRKCVMARPGRVLVIADYSNIEVRVIAEITRDANLVRLFNEDKDMHCMTGSYMMGVTYDEMYHKYKVEKIPEFITARNNSKVPNFGLGYKASIPKLQWMAWEQYGLDWTLEEAAKQHTLWFSLYPGVKTWHDVVGLTVNNGSGVLSVENALGRRRVMQRHIMVHPSAKGVEKGEKSYSKGALPAALNFPVQSLSSELTKRAMVSLMRKVDILLQVHDELVIECDAADADRVLALVEEHMMRSADGLLTVVPNKVDGQISPYWRK